MTLIKKSGSEYFYDEEEEEEEQQQYDEEKAMMSYALFIDPTPSNLHPYYPHYYFGEHAYQSPPQSPHHDQSR